jgi:hypothetical protein
MSLETDELADAALRFSEAIRAERTSTFDALASERQAALKIIEALRDERATRAREASGRFVFGVALGVAAGVAAIYYVSQRASEEARLGLSAGPAPTLAAPQPEQSLADMLKERFQKALADGQRAMKGREDELWQRYRQRLTEGPERPPQAPPDDLLF